MFRKFINKTINKGYSAQNCELCEKDLSVFTLSRIHKCKRCLRFVCADCGSKKAIITGYEEKPDVPHRICDVCHRELDIQDKIIRSNDLSWNQNSFLSERWRNAINLSKLDKENSQAVGYNYYEYIEQFRQNTQNYEQDIEIITKDVDLGRSDATVFNYSSRQFIEKLQHGLSAEVCRQNIKNVLIALVVRYPSLGYCQGMNYLAAILLCFTNEEIAFSLYCHLIEHILPDKYYQKNGKGSGLIGYLAECYVLRNLIPSHFDKADVEPIQNFLEMQCPNFLLTLLINTLNITCIFYTWDLMFTENSVLFTLMFTALRLIIFPSFTQQQQIVPLEKCIIAMVKINLPLILNYSKNLNVADALLRNTSYDNLKVHMNFEIPKNQRSALMDSFFLEFSEKWTKNTSNIHYQLKKITEFSIDEIKQLQQEFNLLIDQKYADTSNESSLSKVVKKGISKQEFNLFMGKMNQERISEQSKDLILDDQLSKIFDLFIEVEGDYGVLDFREFLCCMSIVTRGDVKQKLEMFFYIFDTNKKQFLSKNEFFFLIDTLMKSLSILENNQELQEAACVFLVSLQEEYMNKEKISLSDFLLLLSHPFISNISHHQKQSIKRRDTCMVMTQQLKNLYR